VDFRTNVYKLVLIISERGTQVAGIGLVVETRRMMGTIGPHEGV
jgi:hypothetical protein